MIELWYIVILLTVNGQPGATVLDNIYSTKANCQQYVEQIDPVVVQDLFDNNGRSYMQYVGAECRSFDHIPITPAQPCGSCHSRD